MDKIPEQLKLDIELEDDQLPPPGDNWLLGRHDENLPFDEEEVLSKVANRTFLILVIYDIVDNKKRTKIAKKLLGYGERVQLSAFECHLTLRKYEEMISKVLPLLDEDKDLLRIYRLTGQTDVRVWGHIPQTYDEDVVIV